MYHAARYKYVVLSIHASANQLLAVNVNFSDTPIEQSRA
jgi:hypothetical protein